MTAVEATPPRPWPTTLSAQVIADARAQVDGGGYASTPLRSNQVGRSALDALRSSVGLSMSHTAPTGATLTPLSALGAQSRRRRKLMLDMGAALTSIAQQLDPHELEPEPVSARLRGEDEVNMFLINTLQQIQRLGASFEARLKDVGGVAPGRATEAGVATAQDGLQEACREQTLRADSLQQQLADAERDLDFTRDKAAKAKMQSLAAAKKIQSLEAELLSRDQALDEVRHAEQGFQDSSKVLLERAVELAMQEGWEQATEAGNAKVVLWTWTSQRDLC